MSSEARPDSATRVNDGSPPPLKLSPEWWACMARREKELGLDADVMMIMAMADAAAAGFKLEREEAKAA